MKRPWTLKRRYRSYISGEWQPWRVHGTYLSEESAKRGEAKEHKRWARANIIIETSISCTAAPVASKEERVIARAPQ
jgi:hypothetical protein